MSSEKPSKPSSFVDALPDLTIGLIGIPVAMSLQTVVEAVVKAAGIWPYQREGLWYFVFIMGMYGILSVGLLMLFEADRANLDDDNLWQRKLITRLAWLVVPLLLATLGMMLLGHSYKENEIIVRDWRFVPEWLAVVVGACNLCLVAVLIWPGSAARARYPHTLPYHCLISCCLFGLAMWQYWR